MTDRADAYSNKETYAFRCEVRAVEEGHRAFANPGGSVKVVSESTPGLNYTVKFFARITGLIHFVCDCKSGENRSHLPIPCKHASLTGRRLEREKIAVWRDGLFWVHSDLKPDGIPQTNSRPTPPPNVSALVD